VPVSTDDCHPALVRLITAGLLLGLLGLLAPSPSYAVPRAVAVPGISGCSTSGELEVCVSSPPTEGHSDAAVINRLRRLFQAASAGDALRVAMFRWEIAQAADDLLAAQQRGARVEIVADHDVVTNRVGRSLLRKVERRDTRRDNVVVCRGACLPWRAPGPAPGGQDVNHLKVVLADLGGERSLTSTSSNLARRQFHQYNSLVRITDERLYAFGLEWWKRLRRQSLRADGETWDDRDKYFAGPPAASIHPRRADLVVSTLRRVRCAPGMRQVDVMVAVIQRHDVRRQLGLLHRNGCRVRVVVDRESIENWMQARVRLADGTVIDLPNKQVRTVSNHDKVYAIHARLGGRERWVVLTGTSNTTCGGLLYNDEIMFRIGGEWVQHRYAAHFRDAFARAHQSPTPRAVPTLGHCRA
jgi:phosphatidylserine/phosphatidylglycerophosphate/cardiolipin synthase-like enzyme